MLGHKCSLHKDREMSLPYEKGILESSASSPGDKFGTDKQPLTSKSLSLPLPPNLSHSPIKLSVNGPKGNDLNISSSNDMHGDQPKSMQSNRLSPQDSVTVGAAITTPAGAVLRKRAFEKCNGDNNQQDSATRRVLRRHKLPTELSNHPTLDSSSTFNTSATGLDNERRLASNIVANPTISTLPTLSNRLKLSEGLSCIDYLPAFRALAIGSTRQLHIVEVIPAVAYDVYRCLHEHLCNSRMPKAEVSGYMDNKYPVTRDACGDNGGEGEPTVFQTSLPTRVMPNLSQCTPTEVYAPDERSTTMKSPVITDFTHPGNEGRVKWRSEGTDTAHNVLENSALHTSASFHRRNASSGPQFSSTNSSSPYVLRNAGVFGGLMKVESVAWYPSCNEASVAFVQPGRAVTVFLDALQFKNDGSYVSQQWRRSQGKGKTLHATLSVGGGSTSTAVVAPSGFMLSSWVMKTSLMTSLSTPGWGKGGNVSVPGNSTMTPSSCSGNGSEQASVERSPAGVLAKELIELSIDCTYVRVECIAWDPHNPHTLALSSTLTHFELWHIPSVSDRVYAPQLVLRPPAHNTRSVARTLAFSPSDANLIIVVVESASAGQVLLFDRRQVEVPRSLDVMGPGLSAAFHPIFSDLLAVCFRKAKTKTDCRVAFLRVLEDSHQAEIVKTGAQVSTSLGDTSYTEVISASTSFRTAMKGMQHHHTDVQREEHIDASSGAVQNALPASVTAAGTEALQPSANIMEVPRVVQQSILQPIDHYASVNRLRWRPGSCGMKLSTESPDHHFRSWFPSPEPFAALCSADGAAIYSSSSWFSGSSGAAAQFYDRNQDFAEKTEGMTPERGELLTMANYARLKSGVELLASQLWFATAATTTDSDVCVWDAVSGFVPVCVASHHSKDGRELNDFAWINELTLVTVFKSGEVVCTCLMNNNHFEDSVLVCPSLEVKEDEALTDHIPSQQQQPLSSSTGTTSCPERATKNHSHMKLCYPPDSAVRVLSLHSIMPTSAVTCDLFGRSFVVRNTSSRLKDYYQCVIQNERRDLIQRLLVQLGNEEIQREKVAKRRGIRIRSHFLFEEILHTLFDDTKCNATSTTRNIIEQDESNKAAQPPPLMEVTRHSRTFSNTATIAPSFLGFQTIVSSKERETGVEGGGKDSETENSTKQLSDTGLNDILALASSSQCLAKPRRRQRNAPTQFFGRILSFFQHPLSREPQECPPDISGADSSMATAHARSLAPHEVKTRHPSFQEEQHPQSEPIESYRFGTATEIKSRTNTDAPHMSPLIAPESYQQQPFQTDPTNLRETLNPLGRFSGTNDMLSLQGAPRHHATLSEVSSAGHRNKTSMAQDCTPQKPHDQTFARSFPVVDTISQRFPDHSHMAIFPLISSPTRICMEQGLTALGSPIRGVSTFSDSSIVIKHSAVNPLERESLVRSGDDKNIALSKELSMARENGTVSSKGCWAIKKDKMNPLVLSRTTFPQSPKIDLAVTISATAALRHDSIILLSPTTERHQNCRQRSFPTREVTNFKTDNKDYTGGTLSGAPVNLWGILNTSSMQHCVNPVIESCVLSNAACMWAYTECRTEINLFVQYALEWDMGYELALTMKRHRHWLDDEAEKEGSNFQEEFKKPGLKPPVVLYDKEKATTPHNLPAASSQSQQYVQLPSSKQIDIIFSNMMLHNCRICETQNSLSAAKTGKGGTDVGSDDDDRRPHDPRAQFWRAASHAWRTHDPETILSVTTSQLEYTSLMGDVQYSLVLYVLFCLWWRLRHHTPHHVATTFSCQGGSATRKDTLLEHFGSDDHQGQNHHTWQHLRPDPPHKTSRIQHTSLSQEAVKDRTGPAQDFYTMPSCPLLPPRSSRSQAVRQQETPHTTETWNQDKPRLFPPKNSDLFPAQPIHPVECHEDISASIQSSPSPGCNDTSCTSEQWKLRALQWLEVYTSELYACKLYVPLNELLLIIPELFQEPSNPVQPKAADIAYEKQMTYVFCGNCTKSELCTLPVKGPDFPAYSTSTAVSAMHRLIHHRSAVTVDMRQENIEQYQIKSTRNTSFPMTALNSSEVSKTLTQVHTEPQLSQVKSNLKNRRKQVPKELLQTEKRKRQKDYIRGLVLGVSHSTDPLAILEDPDSSQETCESEDSYSVDYSYSVSRMGSTHSLATSITTESLNLSSQCEPESLSLLVRRHRAKEGQCAKQVTHGSVDMGNRANPQNASIASSRSTEDDAAINNVDNEVNLNAVDTEEISISLLPGHAIPNNAECLRCHNSNAMMCVVCEEVVEGLFYWLRSCGHGGHVHHMQQWMSISSYCPKCGVPITSAASQQ